VHHDGTAASNHYVIARYGTNRLTVFAVTNPIYSNRTISQADVTIPAPAAASPAGTSAFRNAYAPYSQGAPQPGTSFFVGMYLNDGVTLTPPLKAVARYGKLHMVFPDANAWFVPSDPALYASIRVVRLDISNYPSIPTSGSAFINRLFGGSNINDPPGTKAHYGWPALEVNSAGDMAIVYTRVGATLSPEIRYSAYGANDSDLQPSQLLKTMGASYTNSVCGQWCSNGGVGNIDTGGAGLDPDDISVWISHQLPDATK